MGVSPLTLKGSATAGRLGNETVKYAALPLLVCRSKDGHRLVDHCITGGISIGVREGLCGTSGKRDGQMGVQKYLMDEKLTIPTNRAQLGNSAWHLLHTTLAHFPSSPTPDEQLALQSYIYLFARLYPCGECAAHFQSILEKYPPQVSNGRVASAWGCHVHNEVNVGLGKGVWDCGRVGEYDCGCGDGGGGDAEASVGEAERRGGEVLAAEANGEKREDERGKLADLPADEREPVKLEKGEYQRGG